MAQTESFVSTEYVSNHAWVRTLGRPDAVDEIADQFERPATAVASTGRERAARWPQRSRGWRAVARLHPQAPLRESA